MNLKNNWDKGKVGQEMAKNWYLKNSYRLVKENYEYRDGRGRLGEIDLIFEKVIGENLEHVATNESGQKVLVFVEVKLRNGNKFGTAQTQITKAKLSFMQKAASHFLMTHPEFKTHFCRFDAVFIQDQVLEIVPNIS